MTDCTRELFQFPSFDRRKIEASFTGGDVSGDGGIFLLRQADRRLGLTAALDRVLPDPRHPLFIVHRQVDLLRQRIFGLALGHEDLKGATRASSSPTSRCAQALVTDRGCDSQDNVESLAFVGIKNGLCPKNPREMKRRFNDPEFAAWQKRRAQAEARIAIFKREFLGQPLRSKGFAHRELMATWAVFVHDLWMLARRPRAKALRSFDRRSVFTAPQKPEKSGRERSRHPRIIPPGGSHPKNRPPPSRKIACGTGS